jgi:hypothetical protein
VLALVGVLACAGTANAGTLWLSTRSSDETPAEYLSATFEFTVVGNAVTLTVTNDTGDTTPAYALSQVFFNSAAGVTLSATNTNGWSFSTGEHADGFGVFDFALMADESGGAPDAIADGNSLTFEFTITAGGPVTADDFITGFSTIPPGDHMAIIAGKFIQGPGDDSGYGAYIPLPPALPMGIAGLVGVAALRRWKRAKVLPRAA